MAINAYKDAPSAGYQIISIDGSSIRMNNASNGIVYINDTSNGQMTIGLTINQATSSNQILAFKHDNVAHGMTGIMETDTYAGFYPISSTSGGVILQAASDADDVNATIRLQGLNGQAADTATSTSSLSDRDWETLSCLNANI